MLSTSLGSLLTPIDMPIVIVAGMVAIGALGIALSLSLILRRRRAAYETASLAEQSLPPADAVDSERFADVFSLLQYHNRAMESRRILQLQMFTAVVTFLLVVSKALGDARVQTMGVAGALGVGTTFLSILALHWFMLHRVEQSNKFDRERYPPPQARAMEVSTC